MKINTRLFLSCLFIIAIGIKLIVSYYIGHKFNPTLWEYEEIAVNIINGKGFLSTWNIEPIKRFNIQFRSLQEPFFPIFCAVIYYFTKHSIFTVLILQIIYASLIPIVVYYIAYKIYDTKTAILSSICSVFAPGIILYSATKLHQMPLYALFFLLSLLLALRLFENSSYINQILLGVVLGISCLIRSTSVFIVFAIFLWLCFSFKIEIKKKIFIVLKVFIIAVVIMAPWITRNYFIYKRLVLFQTSDGPFLYMGTNPNATGTLYLSDGRFQLEGIPKELLSGYNTLTDIQFRDLMKSEAWKFIKQDPIRILKLSLLRFFYFWWFSPLSGRAVGYEYPEKFIKLYKIYYATLLSIFLCQLFFIIKKWFSKTNSLLSKEILVLLFLLAVMTPHIISYPEGRHRFAIEPLMFILFSNRINLILNSLYRKIARCIRCPLIPKI